MQLIIITIFFFCLQVLYYICIIVHLFIFLLIYLIVFTLQALYIFLALAIVCDDYFVTSLEKICEVRMNLQLASRS